MESKLSTEIHSNTQAIIGIHGELEKIQNDHRICIKQSNYHPQNTAKSLDGNQTCTVNRLVKDNHQLVENINNLFIDSKSTRCQQKMHGKSTFQDRTMPHDWLNYLPFVETDQEENVNSNVSIQLDYNPTRENPVETLPLTKMSPRTSSHNNTNVIPDEVLHTPIASLGADSRNVCMEDQLKAYRLKSFKEQSKPYCGRVNKTRFQTEYNH
jgi:hypothetical protein